MRRLAIVSFSILVSTTAWADAQKAQSCAGGLAAESKIIYEASVADVKAGNDIKSVLEAKTRSLVIDGKVTRSSARESAEAAGACLKILKS